jgi:hypothetical protein
MRFLQVILILFAFTSPSFAGVIAPIPRGIDFQKLKDDIAAAPKEKDDEDPAAILERIAKNAEGIGDRLKDKDTGTETREKQEQLLKDIDKLLKPPPPMDGGGGGGSSDMPPPPMGGTPPPPMGGGKGGDEMPPPMGGGSKPRPQRTGSRPEPMPGAPKPMPMMGEPGMGEPMTGPMNVGEKPMGKAGNGGNSALPLEDPFTKQIWGHLPERLRQQASQYYREQYMPKYGELLKLYYSNLAEREKAPQK